MCLMFCFSFFVSNAQYWLWGVNSSGIKDIGSGGFVTTDKQGNAYCTGNYCSIIKFGSFNLTSVASYSVFLVKYNTSGVVQWAYSPDAESIRQNVATAITHDANNDILIAGYFTGYVKFGSDSLYSDIHYNPSLFIAKFDVNGNPLWAVEANKPASQTYTSVTNITTDKKGNIYITGWYEDSIFFSSDTLGTLYTNKDVFLCKYDKNGKFLWARNPRITNAGCEAQGNGLAADNNGNVYVAGQFEDTLIFGPYILSGDASAFLAKFDSSGNLKWANCLHGYGAFYASSVATDSKNNPYISGYFIDTAYVGTIKLVSPLNYINVFYAKYDTGGNVQWARQSENNAPNSDWYAPSITLDVNNNIYIAGNNGNFGQPTKLKFDGVTLYTDTTYAAFVLKCNDSGVGICGGVLNNGAYNGSYDNMAIDSTGNYIYVTGTINNESMICGPDTLFPKGGGLSPYVARWAGCNPITENVENSKAESFSMTVYPNPSKGVYAFAIKNYQLKIKNSVEVYNVMGQQVYSNSLQIPDSSFQIDLTSQPSGIYLYRVITESGTLLGEGKLIKE
jgi:hypothetical protein